MKYFIRHFVYLSLLLVFASPGYAFYVNQVRFANKLCQFCTTTLYFNASVNDTFGAPRAFIDTSSVTIAKELNKAQFIVHRTTYENKDQFCSSPVDQQVPQPDAKGIVWIDLYAQGCYLQFPGGNYKFFPWLKE